MPLLLKKQYPEFSLYIWKIDESEHDFRPLVSRKNYDTIINNVKLKKRKLEKLSQQCLQDIAGINNEDLSYYPNGKPKLKSESHISFSHSADLSALLISEENCGLDLEIPSNKILRIASKFISEKEKNKFASDEYTYWAWSIKEAVFKYFGERVLFKDHLDIEKIDLIDKLAIVNYDGFHGKGQFDLELLRFKNAYLAFTKQYRSL